MLLSSGAPGLDAESDAEGAGSSAWTRTRDPAVNSRLLWCCPAPCSARSLRLLRASCLPQASGSGPCSLVLGRRARGRARSCSAAAACARACARRPRAPRGRPSLTSRNDRNGDENRRSRSAFACVLPGPWTDGRSLRGRPALRWRAAPAPCVWRSPLASRRLATARPTRERDFSSNEYRDPGHAPCSMRGVSTPSAPACAARSYVYERRRPESTTLHRVVRENLATLYAAVEQGFASPLGSFVKDELEGYLACGVLARGSATMQCENAECRQKKLVAFCCKGRGFCPSCMGGRGRNRSQFGGLAELERPQRIGHPQQIGRAGDEPGRVQPGGERAGNGAKTGPDSVNLQRERST
jgi:hypothetical protein